MHNVIIKAALQLDALNNKEKNGTARDPNEYRHKQPIGIVKSMLQDVCRALDGNEQQAYNHQQAGNPALYNKRLRPKTHSFNRDESTLEQ